VFVVGADRSGTTLLRLVLNRHPDLAIPPESWFLLLLMERIRVGQPLSGRRLEQAARVVSRHRRFQDWKLSRTDPHLAGVIARGPFADLAGFTDAVFRSETGSVHRWGDKTPEYVFYLAQLVEHFPGARFVAIVRDPRDVALSLLPLGWRGTTPWAVASYLRRVADALDRGVERLGDRILVIRYDDVILGADRVIDRVCRHVGLRPEPGMDRFWEDADEHVPARERAGYHHKLTRRPTEQDLDQWRHARDAESQRAIAVVEALLTDHIERHGFPTPEMTRPPTLRCWAKVAHARLEMQRRGRHAAGRLKRGALWTMGR
jgi:hypothetical protein